MILKLFGTELQPKSNCAGIVPLYVAVGDIGLPEIEAVKQMSRLDLERTTLMYIEGAKDSVRKMNGETEVQVTENPIARAQELWDNQKVLVVQCAGHPLNKHNVVPVQLGTWPKLGWLSVCLSDFHDRPYGTSHWLPSVFLRNSYVVAQEESIIEQQKAEIVRLEKSVAQEKSIIELQNTEISFLRKRVSYLQQTTSKARKSFVKKASKKKSENKEKSKPAVFICDKCGKSYSTDGSLRTHRYKDHGPKSKKNCKCCKRMVPSGNYSKHLTVQFFDPSIVKQILWRSLL